MYSAERHYTSRIAPRSYAAVTPHTRGDTWEYNPLSEIIIRFNHCCFWPNSHSAFCLAGSVPMEATGRISIQSPKRDG